MGKRRNIKSISTVLLLSILVLGCSSTPAGSTSNPNNSQGNNQAKPQEKNQAATNSQTSQQASGMSEEVAKLYEAAKKEGKVIFWSPDDVEASKMQEDFAKKFPGIKVEHFEIQPPEALQKIITEDSAKQTNVDVFDVYYNDTKQLLDRDLVMKYEWNKVFGLNPKIIHFDNRALTTWHLSFPIVYNTNLVKESEVPKSWDDLKDPKWKGKLLLESRGNAFPILSYLWGEEKTVNFVKDLMKQDPLIIKGGTPSTQAIVNGQAAIGIGSYAFKVEPMKKKGAPIEWAKIGPIPLISHVSGVLKKAPHPNAALLYTYWMASDDGLKSREAVGGTRLEGPGLGQMGKLMAEKKIETISEVPEKQEISSKVESEVKKILSSLKK